MIQDTNDMTIREAQTEVDEWIKTVGVRYFNELTNLGILAEEVGELSRLLVRIYGEQSFKKSDLQKQTGHGIESNEMEDYIHQGKLHPVIEKEMLSDEMADILWVLFCLANQTGTDLTEAFRKNLTKKTTRDADRHRNNEKIR